MTEATGRAEDSAAARGDEPAVPDTHVVAMLRERLDAGGQDTGASGAVTQKTIAASR